MELLFKQENFSVEFKEALGFVDSDMKWRKLKPDILVASRNLLSLIGKPTYDALIANYNKLDSDASKDTTLLEFSKNAIAINAYTLHAPVNDLGHTPNGRKMRSSDDEKTPFEWMIKNDDDNLQKRANRSLDNLIKYMDDAFDAWKESDVYKQSYSSYIRSVDEFDPYYVLESRLLLLKLTPAIIRAEKSLVVSRIGSELNEALKTYRKTQPETVSQQYEDLIRAIQEVCAYYSLSWAIPRLQLTLFPEGVLQPYRSDRSTISSRKTSEGMQVDQVSQLFKEDYERALIDLEGLVATPEEIETETIEMSDGFDDDDPFVNT